MSTQVLDNVPTDQVPTVINEALDSKPTPVKIEIISNGNSNTWTIIGHFS